MANHPRRFWRDREEVPASARPAPGPDGRVVRTAPAGTETDRVADGGRGASRNPVAGIAAVESGSAANAGARTGRAETLDRRPVAGLGRVEVVRTRPAVAGLGRVEVVRTRPAVEALVRAAARTRPAVEALVRAVARTRAAADSPAVDTRTAPTPGAGQADHAAASACPTAVARRVRAPRARRRRAAAERAARAAAVATAWLVARPAAANVRAVAGWRGRARLHRVLRRRPRRLLRRVDGRVVVWGRRTRPILWLPEPASRPTAPKRR